MDANDAERKISDSTKAIIPVHYASNPVGIEHIYKLAARYRLRVVEDAAQSFGSQRGGRVVGSNGDIVCFSFDGIKNITAGEGGAVVSSDKAVIRRVQDARLLGVERDTEQRYSGMRSWDFDVTHQGYRYHMSNIMAAIGIAQLERIDLFKTRRQEIAKRYVEAFSEIDEIEVLEINFDAIIPHIFVIKADARDELRQYLGVQGIESGIHYKPNHLLSMYKTPSPLCITEALYERIISLPCHYDLSNSEQERIISAIVMFYKIRQYP